VEVVKTKTLVRERIGGKDCDMLWENLLQFLSHDTTDD
jgi:hypothetical protein